MPEEPHSRAWLQMADSVQQRRQALPAWQNSEGLSTTALAVAGLLQMLEGDFGSELENSSRTCCLDSTEARIVRVISHRCPDSGAGERIKSVLMMIKHVECLGPELERDPFGKFKIFAQAHIPVVDSGAAQNVSTAIAELPRKRLTEGYARQVCGHTAGCCRRVRVRGYRVVEPMIDVLLKSTGIRITDYVAAIGECCQNQQIVVAENGEREASLERGDRG